MCSGETPGIGVGTYRRPTSPRQPPTLHGRYRRSQLYPTLRRIDEYLVRWLMHKYKRFKGCSGRAYAFLVGIKERQPALFAHWQVAALTAG